MFIEQERNTLNNSLKKFINYLKKVTFKICYNKLVGIFHFKTTIYNKIDNY